MSENKRIKLNCDRIVDVLGRDWSESCEAHQYRRSLQERGVNDTDQVQPASERRAECPLKIESFLRVHLGLAKPDGNNAFAQVFCVGLYESVLECL